MRAFIKGEGGLQGRSKAVRRNLVAALGLVVVGVIGWSPASAADTTDTIEEVRNHVSCYPFGLDKIGAGDHAAGMAIWNKCYAPDFKFRVEVPGRTVTCPGDGCPFPKDMDPISMRAAFAESEYRSYKFIRTSHHLTNITVNPTSEDEADVKAYVQSWHQRNDDFTFLAASDWDIHVAKRDGKWMIVSEDFKVTLAGLLVPPGPTPDVDWTVASKK
ncbi:nuclear transport factor 2 family protein [Ensifer adhaerens]|uniref:Nuclear transport factor 2 family protein n=1 Tax=Ensifer adhaerens TaxID=106592 RepID=A0A9Q8YHV6_ENSAD|nr:nuclear transport factor 2 family protein [Ensifer adhaerens]USJ28431.1 nuclear transport factor 2 family protein [Ensifer adhaerens]